MTGFCGWICIIWKFEFEKMVLESSNQLLKSLNTQKWGTKPSTKYLIVDDGIITHKTPITHKPKVQDMISHKAN